MNNTRNNKLNEAEKSTILQDIALINETIFSILIFIPVIITALMSSCLSKEILINRLNNKETDMNPRPTPAELAVISNQLSLFGLIVAGDVASKRFIQKCCQNLKPEELEPYRIFLFLAVARIIVSFISLRTTQEVGRGQQIEIE